MPVLEKPNPENKFLAVQTELLTASYPRLTEKELLGGKSIGEDIPRALFKAPFGLPS